MDHHGADASEGHVHHHGSHQGAQGLLPRALPTKDTIPLGCHTMEIMEEAMEETTEESTPSTGITEEEDTT